MGMMGKYQINVHVIHGHFLKFMQPKFYKWMQKCKNAINMWSAPMPCLRNWRSRSQGTHWDLRDVSHCPGSMSWVDASSMSVMSSMALLAIFDKAFPSSLQRCEKKKNRPTAAWTGQTGCFAKVLIPATKHPSNGSSQGFIWFISGMFEDWGHQQSKFEAETGRLVPPTFPNSVLLHQQVRLCTVQGN